MFNMMLGCGFIDLADDDVDEKWHSAAVSLVIDEDAPRWHVRRMFLSVLQRRQVV